MAFDSTKIIYDPSIQVASFTPASVTASNKTVGEWYEEDFIFKIGIRYDVADSYNTFDSDDIETWQAANSIDDFLAYNVSVNNTGIITRLSIADDGFTAQNVNGYLCGIAQWAVHVRYMFNTGLVTRTITTTLSANITSDFWSDGNNDNTISPLEAVITATSKAAEIVENRLDWDFSVVPDTLTINADGTTEFTVRVAGLDADSQFDNFGGDLSDNYSGDDVSQFFSATLSDYDDLISTITCEGQYGSSAYVTLHVLLSNIDVEHAAANAGSTIDVIVTCTDQSFASESHSANMTGSKVVTLQTDDYCIVTNDDTDEVIGDTLTLQIGTPITLKVVSSQEVFANGFIGDLLDDSLIATVTTDKQSDYLKYLTITPTAEGTHNFYIRYGNLTTGTIAKTISITVEEEEEFGCYVGYLEEEYTYDSHDNNETINITTTENATDREHRIAVWISDGAGDVEFGAQYALIEVINGDASLLSFYSPITTIEPTTINGVSLYPLMEGGVYSFYIDWSVDTPFNDLTIRVTPYKDGIYNTAKAWTINVTNDAIDSTSSVEEVTAGTFQVGGDVVAATGAGIAGLLTPLQLVSQDYTLIDNGNFTLTLKQPIEVTKTITEHWHYAGDVEQEPIVGTIECLRLGFSDTIFSVSGDIVDGTDVMNELNKSITLTEISNVASSGLISLSVEGEYSDGTAIDKNFTVTILFTEQPSEWYLIRTTTAPTLPTGWAFTSALSIADTDVAQRIKLVARYGDTDEQKDVYIFYVPSTHRIVVSGEGWNGDYDADPIILSLNNSTNLFTLLNLPATAETVNDSPFEVEVTAANYAGTIKLRLHRSIE